MGEGEDKQTEMSVYSADYMMNIGLEGDSSKYVKQ